MEGWNYFWLNSFVPPSGLNWTVFIYVTGPRQGVRLVCGDADAYGLQFRVQSSNSKQKIHQDKHIQR